MNEGIGTIVLAAGKGSRMKSKVFNKVTLTVADKPLILHIVERLQELRLSPIVLVVGFAKQSVIDIVGKTVTYAEQAKRLGTAHAAIKGLSKIPQTIKHVLIVYGDEFSYPKEKTQQLIDTHLSSGSALTMLTIIQDNPYGLGRIIRDDKENLLKIVEEKDATQEEKKIQEVNPGCYICTREFLKTYLPKIDKSPVTGEYYLTDIIDLAIKNKEKITTVFAGNMLWRGVNTQEELEEARQIIGKIVQ